jgi:hypothetical protein
VPNKRPSVKNEKQYEKLKEKGMSKQRAARIANSPGASSRGGKKSGSGDPAEDHLARRDHRPKEVVRTQGRAGRRPEALVDARP